MANTRFSLPILACVLCIGAAANALAQDPSSQSSPAEPRFALTFGYPGGGGVVGVVWEAGARTALRSQLSVGGSVWTAPDQPTYSSYRFGLDVSLLRFVARKDDAQVYVGPRLTYSRNNSNYALDYSLGAGAVLGLQYRLARRIGLYGEVGLDYEYGHQTSDLSEPSVHTIASRNSVGLNLYF